MNPTGEITLTIDDKEYNLKPSVKALLRIEETLDRGLIEIVQSLSEGKIRIGHLAVVIHHGMMFGGNAGQIPTVEAVAAWLLRNNLTTATPSVVRFLSEGLSAGPKD